MEYHKVKGYPLKKEVFVIGTCFVKSPIRTILWLLAREYPTRVSIEWIMDPDPKNNNAFVQNNKYILIYQLYYN